MKIQLKYREGKSKIIDYDVNVGSIPTRNSETDEKFIKAVMPSEIKDDSEYLYRLSLSADSSVYGSDDLFEFIG